MNHSTIPHFKAAHMAAHSTLERVILDAQIKIETWFRSAFLDQKGLMTSSVDIRNAGFKISPVDTNLFPAGFNNLSEESYPLAIQALQFTLEKILPTCQKILLIPENHTRNPYYFESLSVLYTLLEKAGYTVKIGSFLANDEPLYVKVGQHGNQTLELLPLRLENQRILANDFKACLILLNNDLSDGIPDIIKNTEQLVIPTPELGWSHRLKSNHFEQYARVTEQFADLLSIDPWLITPYFKDCGKMSFDDKSHDDALMHQTDEMFSQIRAKYREYQIKEKPFVVIKANQGTYGMAVMMVQSPEDIKNLNRKQRQKMTKSKGGKGVDQIVLQEGVHTIETIGALHSVAEPVVYMIGHHVVGGFYRIHTQKGPLENLNSPGMHFEPLAFDACCNNPDNRMSPHTAENTFYVYSVIARLALLATCYESEALKEAP